MSLLSEEIEARIAECKPDCLSSFRTKLIETGGRSGQWHTRYQIDCRCQNPYFFVEAAQAKQLKGVCSPHEVISHRTPIELVCSECKSRTLLLDACLHGLKAETSDLPEPDGRVIMVRCTQQPVALRVEFEYDKLQDLATPSIALHGEDCFTCVRLQASSTHGKTFTELLTIKNL